MHARTCFGWPPRKPTAWLLLAWLGVLVVRTWIFTPILIRGNSMVPTLPPGRIALVNKLAYTFARPRRGDVVVIWTDHELIVKRVVALAGELIAATNGVLYVEGKPLPAPCAQAADDFAIAASRVPADRCVVAGDNSSEAAVLLVSTGRILGRVLGCSKRTGPVPICPAT